ncbi:MAG: hypothetical protein FWB76_00015 [Oscillospiraceae bacterium]|nr:hypothetical protein [Oscillospiraceae bacterium]
MVAIGYLMTAIGSLLAGIVVFVAYFILGIGIDLPPIDMGFFELHFWMAGFIPLFFAVTFGISALWTWLRN